MNRADIKNTIQPTLKAIVITGMFILAFQEVSYGQNKKKILKNNLKQAERNVRNKLNETISKEKKKSKNSKWTDVLGNLVSRVGGNNVDYKKTEDGKGKLSLGRVGNVEYSRKK